MKHLVLALLTLSACAVSSDLDGEQSTAEVELSLELEPAPQTLCSYKGCSVDQDCITACATPKAKCTGAIVKSCHIILGAP